MSKPLVITSQSDLEALRHSSHVEKMLDNALDDLQDAMKQNEKLTAALKDAVSQNRPLRNSRDWHRIGMWMFAVIALVEAIALFGVTR